MIHSAEGQFQWQCLQRITLFLGYIISLVHLLQNRIASSPSTFVMPHGIEVWRIFTHAYQCSRFLYFQFIRSSIEINLSSRLYPDCIIQKVKLIQIHIYNLLLGIKTLKLYGNYPLYRLLEQPFHNILGIWRKQQFSQLLGNSTTPSGTFLKKEAPFYHCSEKGFSIDARMLPETNILCCD